MKIIVVNGKDKIIGLKDRLDITSKDIYRVSALWLTDDNDEILLARRSYMKKKDPGMWGPAVAGTVEEKETYESNIVKEAEEELGLTNLKIKKGIKQRIRKPYNHFTQWFFSKIKRDTDIFNPNKEVEEVKWFDKKELLKSIEKNPEEFVHSMRKFIKSIF